MATTQLALTLPVPWLTLLAEVATLELAILELTRLELATDDELLLELIALDGVLDATLEGADEAAPTIPNGAGWLVQVRAEIQLLLFSQPQPLWVVTHSG